MGRKPDEFRAVIDENTILYFKMIDLIALRPIFSIREILIPWLKDGNMPDRRVFNVQMINPIYESDIVLFEHPPFGDYIGIVAYAAPVFLLTSKKNYNLFRLGGVKPGGNCWNYKSLDPEDYMPQPKLTIIGNVHLLTDELEDQLKKYEWKSDKTDDGVV